LPIRFGVPYLYSKFSTVSELLDILKAKELVEKLRGRRAQVIVLTGDGRDDLRVLKHCSRIYNGRKTLWYPGVVAP